MVKVCSMTNYPKENEELYKESFEKYPYELSIFQKYAIEAINEGHHVLVTAHTGTGKTLPAEFAIEHFVSKGKKVIYTGPIKTLMNQKFYDFKNKYPHISFGILTGDIKFNPEANVLIMTAEILLNKLYQINSNSQTNNNIDFDIDFDNELACVVMDEVHYVNESERGHVWENSLMMLPSHIQLVMLSATIDQPENFAYWCENLHKDSNKQVYLTNSTHRVVPLTHYSFITTNQSIFKIIKDKTVQEEIKSVINKPFIIQDSRGKFNDEHYHKMTKTLKLFDNNNVRVKRAHVLNQVTKYLVENEMLPALCFVLSRKQLEISANEITTNLQEFDSKVPYTVDRECEQILRSKLPNFQEYLNLPEYVNMLSLLRKGIAIHHSGVLPVIKEIVELLYAKGYIKLLFATETFSIGVNMPTKTVIFTDVNKFDGNVNRMLYSHEMSQMSGRAGRRGIDTVGHCIHLNNLFRNVDSVSYKNMMNGKPQTLSSKFKISYNLLLNLLDIGDTNLVNFASRSMVTGDLDKEIKILTQKMIELDAELDTMKERSFYLRTPIEVIEEFISLEKDRPHSVNKKRKDIEKRIREIHENCKFIENDRNSYQKRFLKESEINDCQKQLDTLQSYIHSGVNTVLQLLQEEDFVNSDISLDNNDLSTTLKLSSKGKIATQLREVHCLVFARILDDKLVDHLSAKELASLFSIFTNIKVQDDMKDFLPQIENVEIKKCIDQITSMYREYSLKESKLNINTGFDYNIHYDLLYYLDKWCECSDVESCKLVLQEMSKEKQIFLGEFVKALLKINNISSEMEKISEMTGNIAFLSKLKEIPNMTLKYVVTNQSLYV